MKSRLSSISLIILLVPLLAMAQLKEQTKAPDFSSILEQPANSFLFGLLDPSKVHMNHTLSMSFGMAGGQQMLQNSYLNTMLFNLSDKVTLRTDLGILSTPYHTFKSNSLDKPQFFGGAELNYQVSDNAFIQLRFESVPYTNYYYNGFYNNYQSPFFKSNDFKQKTE